MFLIFSAMARVLQRRTHRSAARTLDAAPGERAPETLARQLAGRSTEEVFEEHLALRASCDVELDIERNYAPDVVMLTCFGVFRGRDGVREGARLLQMQIGDARVTYVRRLVHRDVAFLEWTAESDSVRVEDGTDTFVIRNGHIVTKTFHYTVKPAAPA
jgi:hypothetical protein